jgi:hypothetical protein
MLLTALNSQHFGKRFRIYEDTGNYDQEHQPLFDIEEFIAEGIDIPEEYFYQGTGVLSDIGPFEHEAFSGYTFTRFTTGDVYLENEDPTYGDSNTYNLAFFDFNRFQDMGFEKKINPNLKQDLQRRVPQFYTRKYGRMVNELTPLPPLDVRKHVFSYLYPEKNGGKFRIKSGKKRKSKTKKRRCRRNG